MKSVVSQKPREREYVKKKKGAWSIVFNVAASCWLGIEKWPLESARQRDPEEQFWIYRY